MTVDLYHTYNDTDDKKSKVIIDVITNNVDEKVPFRSFLSHVTFLVESRAK